MGGGCRHAVVRLLEQRTSSRDGPRRSEASWRGTRAKHDLKETHDVAATMRNLTDEMLALSKCKDYVVNKGHYFGTSQFEATEPSERGLTDDDKRALIGFIKMF